MDGIRRCPDHGYFADGRCPACGADGQQVLSGERRPRLSKFLSGLLRHFPDEYDLDVDDGGWADRDAVLAIVTDRYRWTDPAAVEGVVALDPKGRFEVDGDRIRAAYGHSIDVTLDGGDDPIPDELYHGTAPRTIDAIREDGLKPMTRQLVHLSGSIEEARAVGARHADDPVILVVDAAGMLADGLRITKRGRSVYTTDRVPPSYLEPMDGTAGRG